MKLRENEKFPSTSSVSLGGEKIRNKIYDDL